MRHICLLTFLILSACSTVQQKSTGGQPLWNYRADLSMQIDTSDPFDGMCSWTLTKPVRIKFISPVGIDRVQVTTCAREAVCQKGGYCDSNFTTTTNWLGKESQTFYFDYTPTHAEAEGLCPMYIAAYSADDLTSWGFIGFRTNETMPAHIDCNGRGAKYAGLTTCQTKNGLEQLMSFSQKVKAVAEPACQMSTTDQQNFKFTPAAGFCRATFQGPDVLGKPDYHRLILLAYKSVLVRVNSTGGLLGNASRRLTRHSAADIAGPKVVGSKARNARGLPGAR